MSKSSPSTSVGLWTPEWETDTERRVIETLGDSTATDANLLVISYRKDPDSWITDWRTHAGLPPVEFGFIRVGSVARSTAAPTSGSSTGPSTPLVTAVSDPTELTELGIQVSQYLEEWETSETGPTVYLDSLTTLLECCELNRVYRFLHVLTGRVKSADGRAFYRLDPNAHDQQTTSTIQTLLDDVIDLTEDT